MEKKETERFALIGHPLGHSLSPEIHALIFRALGIDGRYDLIDVPPGDLALSAKKLLSDYRGFNCTIPYKKSIIPYLDTTDEKAGLFSAVNTVYKKKGYNTDAAGFAAAGFSYQGCRLLVLGSGGAARIMIHTAAAGGAAEIVIKSRTPEKLKDLLISLRSRYPQCRFAAISDLRETEAAFHYILNATPLGMWPQAGGLPLPREAYLRLLQTKEIRAVFDAVYNPPATRFVLLARSSGVRAEGGLRMLFHQAVEAQKIWHPELKERFDDPGVRETLRRGRQGLALKLFTDFPQKILLTGFMAAGKSTLARKLSEAIGRPEAFVDSDDYIEKAAGRPVREIFRKEGEAAFRLMEKKALSRLLAMDESLIIATGGGMLQDPELLSLARSAGALIVTLDVPLEEALRRTAGDTARPLLNKPRKAVESLYNKRRTNYLEAADLVIDAGRPPEECLRTLQSMLFAEDFAADKK